MVMLAQPPTAGGRSSPPAFIEVRYGTHRLVSGLDGWTVGAVKAAARDRWGLPYFCDAIVNGRVVGVGVTLWVGDRLEFRRPFGFKAAEDNPYAEADLLIETTPELQQVVAQGNAREAVRKSVQFCLARYGQPGRNDLASVFEVLARIASSVDVTASSINRIADRLAPQPSDIVDSVWVAERLGCTTTWIADLARQGKIPAACIVPGTGNGKVWKFHRGPIERWLATR